MDLLLLGGSQIELVECAHQAAMAPVVVTVPVMMVAPVVVVMMVMVLVAIAAVLAPTPILALYGVWMRGRAVIRRVLSQNAACKAADRHRQNQLMQSV